MSTLGRRGMNAPRPVGRGLPLLVIPAKAAAMRPSPLLLLLLSLSACAAGRGEPVRLVKHAVYQAVGGPPGWTLAVARDEIVLRLAAERPGEPALIMRYPAPRAGFGDGVKTWEAGPAGRSISIEARRADCGSGAVRFRDEVRVRLGERVLQGCGGRLTPGGRG